MHIDVETDGEAVLMGTQSISGGGSVKWYATKK